MFDGQQLRLRGCHGTATKELPEPKLSGAFMIQADSSLFTECETGWRLPVAATEGYRDLERAYRTRRDLATESLYVTVDGRVQLLPPSGDPSATLSAVPTLVVNQFLSASPGQRCGERTSSAGSPSSGQSQWAGLAGSWRLTQLAGERPELKRPIQLTIEVKESRVTGFSGCNRFTGSWKVDETKLQFSGVASTKMACLGPAAQWESRFLKALETVSSYRISGPQLELIGSDGAAIATLERH
jgi:putative lipoprotein